MDDHKLSRLNFIITIIATIVGAIFAWYQQSLNQQIEAFRNSVDQNRANITQVIEDVKRIDSKLAAMNGALPNGQPNLAAVVQEHEQKLQLLQDTLNKLYSSPR